MDVLLSMADWRAVNFYAGLAGFALAVAAAGTGLLSVYASYRQQAIDDAEKQQLQATVQATKAGSDRASAEAAEARRAAAQGQDEIAALRHEVERAKASETQQAEMNAALLQRMTSAERRVVATETLATEQARDTTRRLQATTGRYVTPAQFRRLAQLAIPPEPRDPIVLMTWGLEEERLNYSDQIRTLLTVKGWPITNWIRGAVYGPGPQPVGLVLSIPKPEPPSVPMLRQLLALLDQPYEEETAPPDKALTLIVGGRR